MLVGLFDSGAMRSDVLSEARAMPEDINVSDKIDSLQQLGIWTKIAEGDVHLVTQKDTLELYRALDDGRKGTINMTDLMTCKQWRGDSDARAGTCC